MTAFPGLLLGAPGVYVAPDAPRPRVATEPMDVAAFVGVAPRGPAFEPVTDRTLIEAGTTHARSVAVPVESWDGYQEQFGGFEGPGLLPHAVAAFFAQGGRRAYVVRIVAREPGRGPGDVPPGCARYRLGPGLPPLRARNEGPWGDRLVIEIGFPVRALAVTARTVDGLVLAPGAAVVAGATVWLPSAGAAPVLAQVVALQRRGRPADAGTDLVAVLDRPPQPGQEWGVQLVEAALTVTDADPARARREEFTGLGLQPAHPRFLLDVVAAESRLVAPLEGSIGAVTPDPALPAVPVAALDLAGKDRRPAVTGVDLFGALPGGDPDGTQGLDALLTAPEVAAVVVPDLYAPDVVLPAPPPDPPAPGDPCFRPCTPAPPGGAPVAVAPSPDLPGLTLDPLDPADLAAIVERQALVVAVAEAVGAVALLDVPPGLRPAQVLGWRSQFDSSSAAAYHPWLRAPGPTPDAPLVDLPPSAVAAGVIARRELTVGITRGPAAGPVAGVVDVAEPVDDARHAELHRLGIDVFRARPDGVWLTAARTLSTGPRQLSVRRLLLLVERVVARQLAWTVFEPDDGRLRAGVARHLDALLRELFAAGAFAGDTPEESWFVRISEPGTAGEGQVVVEIGLAPSEPLEFIVLRVVLDAGGAIETGLDVGRRGDG